MSETIFAALLGAIAGGAIGICATYYGNRLARSTAIEAIKLQEFNKAAAEFRSAFVDAIYLLRQNIETGEKVVPHIVTSDVFISHEKAKILFEAFMPDSELTGFRTAWEKYKDYEENYYRESLDASQATKRPDVNPQKKESKIHFSQHCLAHIENLLVYANPK